MFNPWAILLLVSPLIGIGFFLAHERFSVRSVRALSSSASLLVIWCLLSVGTLLLSATVAVGVFVLAFHVTEEVLMALASHILFGLIALIAIPYCLHLANERAKVIKRVDENHSARPAVVLMLVSSVAFMAIWFQLLELLPGLEIID